MAKNKDLNAAQKARKDEFYTQLTDIEKEMRYYRKHFQGKVVFCNCDDPFESNFFKYFVLNFNRLKLKKLICTCYAGSPIMGEQITIADLLNRPEIPQETPYRAIVNTVYDKTGDGAVDMLDVAELFKTGENELTELQGDGDFRSQECIELLEEADIVVTNPPFSMFREYVAQLIDYDKKFIIIGNQNAITYKEVFPLIKNNQMWLGKGFAGNVGFFFSPYEDYAVASDHKAGMIRISGVMWFTNLDLKHRHEELILAKRYSESEYPKYINFDAIEVSKTIDIPYDYTGLMGVPITFLTKYNPDQFEIIGTSLELAQPISEVVQKGTYMPGGRRFYTDRITSADKEKGYLYHREYDRIVIRNRHPEEPKE